MAGTEVAPRSPYEEDIHAASETVTRAAGGTVRQLAFAGVAAVWLLREQSGAAVHLSSWLLWALACFALTLMLDLVLVLYGARYFSRLSSRLIERDATNYVGAGLVRVPAGWESNPDPPAHVRYIRRAGRLFWAKAASIIVGYALLAVAFATQLVR